MASVDRRSPRPSRTTAATNEDPAARQNIFLAKQRQIVAVFRKNSLSQQARSGKSFRDRLRRLHGDDNVFFARPAGVFCAMMLHNFQRRGNLFQLLTGFIADFATQIATAWARPFIVAQFVHHFFTRKMLGQWPTTVADDRGLYVLVRHCSLSTRFLPTRLRHCCRHSWARCLRRQTEVLRPAS